MYLSKIMGMRILITSKLLLHYLHKMMNMHAYQAYWEDYTPWFFGGSLLGLRQETGNNGMINFCIIQ